MKLNITEEKLNRIIKETIEEFVGNDDGMAFDIDLSKFSEESLRQQYRDLRINPSITCYGNKLYSPCNIKESVGDIADPDDVVNGIRTKYNLPPEYVVKREANNKIYVYVIVAVIGINDELIKDDMSKFGYYPGYCRKKEEYGMRFNIIQFEPYSQLQNDETDEVKSNNKILYHWTPCYNLKDISQSGLIPYHKNKVFNFPPRVYLIKSGTSKNELLRLGKELCFTNEDERNDGKYALLTIDLSNLDDNIKFFYDPNSEAGIYTEQAIPRENIHVYGVMNVGLEEGNVNQEN